MSNKTNVQTQLAQLTERRDLLSKQRGDLLVELATSQAALVEGTGSAREVSMVQCEANALRDAITTTSDQIEKAREVLAQIETEEERERQRERGRRILHEANELFDAHEAACLRASAQVQAEVEEMLDTRGKLVALQREFAALQATYDLAAVAKECGLDFGAIRVDFAYYKFNRDLPAGAWGVESALNYLINERSRQTATLPKALTRDSIPLDIKFRPVGGPPAGVQSRAVGPDRIDREDIQK